MAMDPNERMKFQTACRRAVAGLQRLPGTSNIDRAMHEVINALESQRDGDGYASNADDADAFLVAALVSLGKLLIPDTAAVPISVQESIAFIGEARVVLLPHRSPDAASGANLEN